MVQVTKWTNIKWHYAFLYRIENKLKYVFQISRYSINDKRNLKNNPEFFMLHKSKKCSLKEERCSQNITFYCVFEKKNSWTTVKQHCI